MLGWRFFLLCVFFVFFLMDVFGGSGSPRRRSREGTDVPEQERWRVLGAFAFPGSHADGPNRIPPDQPPTPPRLRPPRAGSERGSPPGCWGGTGARRDGRAVWGDGGAGATAAGGAQLDGSWDQEGQGRADGGLKAEQ